MSIRLPHCTPFRDGYAYIRRVPADVAAKLPRLKSGAVRRHWKHTFPSRMSDNEIRVAVAALTREHDTKIAEARAGKIIDDAAVAQIEALARDLKRSGVRYDAMQFFAEAAKIGRAAGGTAPVSSAILSALEHGKVRTERMTLADARQIYGKEAREISTAMNSFAPFGGSKDIRDIEIEDVAAWAKATGGIDRYRKSLRTVIAAGFLNLKISQTNPFSLTAHREDTFKGDGERLAFHKSHLEAIDSYLAGSKRVGRDVRNILRMMQYTGAGPAEIAGLMLGDVSLKPGDEYISIQKNEQRDLKVRRKRSAKRDPARKRFIPLIGLALEAVKDALEHAQGDVIFPGFRKDRGAVSISGKLNDAIYAAGIYKPPKGKPRSRLTAYSYRHTMREAMRTAGVADWLAKRIAGTEEKGTDAGYGARSSDRATMRAAIQSAIPKLGEIPETEYTKEELVIQRKVV